MAALALMLIPSGADAFCGFYVSGAGAKLFNNATQVVLMRSGTRTVLSMQNNYQGPPQDFAMVVPVPEVLQEENVKTLPSDVFDRVDQLGAPRLVEYWEQDPCYRPPRPMPRRSRAMKGAAPSAMARDEEMAAPAVKIEAQFVVGEYDIVILSATDSSALDIWLKQNGYKIPAGAERVLRPYVASGMKFFVAKVDIEKVKFDKSGRTLLSPLRFHYDSETFTLPIRLGLLNSKGTQDLIVNILAPQRYQVANYKNTFIPTNLRVRRKTKSDFASFYASLFDTVMRQNPGSVVTEYSWQASSCDPCPGGSGGLGFGDIQLLGGDVVGGGNLNIATGGPRPMPRGRRPAPPPIANMGAWTLTRLHTRYTKDNIGDDLVFEASNAIEGGRGGYSGRPLPHGVQTASVNNFQGRYYILNHWRGPVSCKNPNYGVWGGPPSQSMYVAGGNRPSVATGTAFAKNRKVRLGGYLAQSVPELRFRYGSEKK